MAKELELIKIPRSKFSREIYLGKICLGMVKVSNGLMENIRNQQETDEYLWEKMKLFGQERTIGFNLRTNGIMRCNGRVCVPTRLEWGKWFWMKNIRACWVFI